MCRQAPVAGPLTQSGERAMEGITTTTSLTPGIPQRPGYGGQVPQRPGYGGQAATGEKAKARDIIAAIKTLQRIEPQAAASHPGRAAGVRSFGGFGAVALGIFPDPVKGAYKDATWQALGACLGISIQVTSMDDQSVQVASIRPQCSFAPIPAA